MNYYLCFLSIAIIRQLYPAIFFTLMSSTFFSRMETQDAWPFSAASSSGIGGCYDIIMNG